MSGILTTRHEVMFADATELSSIPDGRVDLVITSPPYPMIAMWDAQFSSQDPAIGKALAEGDGQASFEGMHGILDRVWRELYRVLRPGGLACINIGDATRSLGGSFQLFPNHSRILQSCVAVGFTCLPQIVWRKPANSPTKFVGSGTLPAGAYVTLEHEWILILRKGELRRFSTEAERRRRRESAFFWEERNLWFSDLWELRGTRQGIEQRPGSGKARGGGKAAGQLDFWETGSAAGAIRERSASFPYELAERLIRMYSLYEDLVLDPFLGAGTTLLAAMGCGRNSLGVEVDRELGALIHRRIDALLGESRQLADDRLRAHEAFIASYRRRGKEPGYRSSTHGFSVISRQESEIRLLVPTAIRAAGSWSWEVEYDHADAAQDSPS
jgi:DNA modification methylase